MEGNEQMTTLAVLPGGEVQVQEVNHAEIRSRVLDLRNRVEQDGWDLSAALYEVYKAALYQAWGYADWRSYVENELDFKLRKAQYMVTIQEWIRAFAPDFVSWVQCMGLTKARLLTGRVTPENAEVWRPRLEGKSAREIEAILAGDDPDAEEDEGGAFEDGSASSDGGAEGEEKPQAFRCSLFPAQWKNVSLALEKAKVLGETDKDSAALDYIATSFLATEGHYKGIKDYMASVERSLGVRIMALKKLDDGTFRIVYGHDLEEELQEAVEEDGGE